MGTAYRVLSTSSLTNHLSSWTPLEDAFSDDTNISVGASATDTPIGFFNVEIPTNGTLPAVQIFSPTNTQTVSGEVGVGVGAQITNQLEGANLYLDDALVGFIDSGGIKFNLDTSHFANGSHTLYAGAVDTANNETLSSPITLDFENPVRWLDASSMFNSFVPIDVDSDIYPADWLVSVTDTNGTIVRTITGSTTDGIIQTTWDGTDDNGLSLPVENLYQITVDVTASGGSSPMMASSLSSTLNATSVSTTTNPHGVPEFAVQKPAPNPMAAYVQMLQIYQQLTPEEQLIYPPLPDAPANNPYATTLIKMSARDMFLAMHHTSSAALSMVAGTASPNANSNNGSGSTKTLVWWENQWNSRQTIVARVPINGGFNNTIGQNCNQIAVLITEANGPDGGAGNNRSVFNDTVQLIKTSSDVYNLTNEFANQSITAFYFYGHGSATGNSIGTQTAVIGAKNVGAQLGNLFLPSLNSTWGRLAGKPAMVTHKPFNFVFLDGCNTALGNFPEAFGIPKAVPVSAYDAPNSTLHKRAFIGWTGTVTFQFDTAHICLRTEHLRPCGCRLMPPTAHFEARTKGFLFRTKSQNPRTTRVFVRTEHHLPRTDGFEPRTGNLIVRTDGWLAFTDNPKRCKGNLLLARGLICSRRRESAD
ncbi:MAG TPA: FlgD immunoglobulin-like domain containing protein [Verrucomicrobiae bacterium]